VGENLGHAYVLFLELLYHICSPGCCTASCNADTNTDGKQSRGVRGGCDVLCAYMALATVHHWPCGGLAWGVYVPR
jgi:hypothetical protein